MNTALKNQTPGLIAPVLNAPDLLSDRYVINSQEMSISDYNKYRTLIYTKLSGWLKQREFALRQFDPGRAKKAQTLLMLLGVYEKATLQNICRFVVKNADSFAELAPGAKSRFYGHYQTKVMAIINLCKQQVVA